MSKPATIFYSWQSDLPSRTNRGLIRDALEAAVKQVRQDGSLEIDARIDSDTQGLSGSPEIHDAIFAKIDAAACAVFDVSIVRRDTFVKGLLGPRRAHPNPNVLLELGYALKSMGEERVLTVLNIATGLPGDLPFDIKQKRVIQYSAGKHTKPAGPRAELASVFEKAIRPVLALGPRDSTRAPPSILEQIAAIPQAPSPNIVLRTKQFGLTRSPFAGVFAPIELYARIVQPPADNEIRFLAGKHQADGLKHLRLTTTQLPAAPSFDSRLNLWEIRVSGNYFAEHRDQWILTDALPSMR